MIDNDTMQKEQNFIQNDAQKLFKLSKLFKSQKRKLCSIVIFTFFFSVLTEYNIMVNAAVAEQLPYEYITGLKGDRVECGIHLPLDVAGSCSFQVSGKLPKGLKTHKRKGENQIYDRGKYGRKGFYV